MGEPLYLGDVTDQQYAENRIRFIETLFEEMAGDGPFDPNDLHAFRLLIPNSDHYIVFRYSIAIIKTVSATKRATEITFGSVLAKRDAWARIAGCMREEAGSVVGSVIV